MDSFKGDYYKSRATDKERKRFDDISKKYCIIHNNQDNFGSQYSPDATIRSFFHITPLILSINDNVAHLHGMFPLGELVILPEESCINVLYPKIIKTIVNTFNRSHGSGTGSSAYNKLLSLILRNNTIGLFQTVNEHRCTDMKDPSSVFVTKQTLATININNKIMIDVNFLI
jgi:hypothetical protein